MHSSRITFCGGAGSVTGANILVESEHTKFLIDCGLEQRENICHEINHGAFSYDPNAIQALVVTHAHLDHIGRIPKLIRDGFHGKIFSTGPTKELAKLMFEDALSLMERNTECTPLYESGDVTKTLSVWETYEYHQPFLITEEIQIELFDAGHILGSAIVLAKKEGRSILFSGDLGNSPEPLLHDTEMPEGSDYLVIESVYGDRVHDAKEKRTERLKEIIEEVRARRGTLLIPSFSIERTQVILYEIYRLVEDGEIESLSVFLDSPLAIQVTEVYERYKTLLNPTAQKTFSDGISPFTFKGLTFTLKKAQSVEIDHIPGPKIIIAGAGMSHGGRIREHEERYVGDPHATILFVGYQAAGSLGRRILDGSRSIEIDGKSVRVRAHIESIFSYSGHSDRDGLLRFAEKTGSKTKQAFVIMGETKASLFLAQRMHDFLGIQAVVPSRGDSFEIDF